MAFKVETPTDWYQHEHMRDLISRSRDIIALGRRLAVENPDVGLTVCIGVVMTALRDDGADRVTGALEDVSKAIDYQTRELKP